MSTSPNVFISWSGERSRLVAEYLRDWICTVVQAAKPWMSESEIEKGSRSLEEITRALAGCKVGITCLTPENTQRPWILYEAGCLSKSIDDRTRLCTYLIGEIQPSDIRPPLGMFQGTRATRDDTLRMMRTVNRVVSDEPVADEILEKVFDKMWPDLENRLTTLPPPVDPTPTAARWKRLWMKYLNSPEHRQPNGKRPNSSILTYPRSSSSFRFSNV